MSVEVLIRLNSSCLTCKVSTVADAYAEIRKYLEDYDFYEAKVWNKHGALVLDTERDGLDILGA